MENNTPETTLEKLVSTASVFEKQKLREELISYLNFLLHERFETLVQLLYRVDVSEEKLKALLQQNPQTDAAVLIADLLIRRQEEKQMIRQTLKNADEIPPDEKW